MQPFLIRLCYKQPAMFRSSVCLFHQTGCTVFAERIIYIAVKVQADGRTVAFVITAQRGLLRHHAVAPFSVKQIRLVVSRMQREDNFVIALIFVIEHRGKIGQQINSVREICVCTSFNASKAVCASAVPPFICLLDQGKLPLLKSVLPPSTTTNARHGTNNRLQKLFQMTQYRL